MIVSSVALFVAGAVLTCAMAVVGYFVRQLDNRLASHDQRDDARFKDLAIELDQLRDDTIAKRHAFRNEVHAAINDNFNRLWSELRAMEQRLKDK